MASSEVMHIFSSLNTSVTPKLRQSFLSAPPPPRRHFFLFSFIPFFLYSITCILHPPTQKSSHLKRGLHPADETKCQYLLLLFLP